MKRRPRIRWRVVITNWTDFGVTTEAAACRSSWATSREWCGCVSALTATRDDNASKRWRFSRVFAVRIRVNPTATVTQLDRAIRIYADASRASRAFTVRPTSTTVWTRRASTVAYASTAWIRTSASVRGRISAATVRSVRAARPCRIYAKTTEFVWTTMIADRFVCARRAIRAETARARWTCAAGGARRVWTVASAWVEWAGTSVDVRTATRALDARSRSNTPRKHPQLQQRPQQQRRQLRTLSLVRASSNKMARLFSWSISTRSSSVAASPRLWASSRSGSEYSCW